MGMKTAISVPDKVFREAERYAPEAVTKALNRTLREIEPQEDAFVAEAARRALERTPW